MKIVLIVAASATVLISGCASFSNADTNAYNDDVDARKVAAIESIAKTRGVTVKWVNYPQKKSSAVGAANAPADPTGT
ncbi:MAG: hypothetical protein ACR2GP_06330 [Burkholderiaceae bacterium]